MLYTKALRGLPVALVLLAASLLLPGCASERVGNLDPERIDGPLFFLLDDYEAMLENGGSPTPEPLTAAEIGDRKFLVRQVRETVQVALEAKAAEDAAAGADVVAPEAGGGE